MLGAAGALCGTAFYASTESLAHPNAKAATTTASGDETRRGVTFDRVRGLDWPDGWTLRARRNAFDARWRGTEDRITASDRAAYASAEARGDVDMMAVIVGEAVDLVSTVRPAATIVSEIIATASSLLETARDLLITTAPTNAE